MSEPTLRELAEAERDARAALAEARKTLPAGRERVRLADIAYAAEIALEKAMENLGTYAVLPVLDAERDALKEAYELEWIAESARYEAGIPEWEPIDTAPRGEDIWILARVPDYPRPLVLSYDDVFEAWTNGSEGPLHPTHWYPLPDFPDV